MNDFDDSEDYSSTYSSFRARSNTWPLNKPDLLINPNNVCIDETLPEIDLEDDDLFTTNENWSTGLVDHDIMSWNPILNAHNQHQQASIIHHHPQQQQQQQQQIVHQQQYESIPSNQRMIVKAQQPHEQQHQQTAQQQQINDPQLSVLNGVDSLEQTSGNAVPTNNQEDPNEYHIQQLHHLRLDNNPPIHQNHHHQQQQHYLTTSSTTTKICLPQQEQGSTPSTVTLETDCYNVFPDHHLHNHHHHHHLHHQPQHPHHHQLQPQSSAIYIDQEQPNDLDHVIKDEQLHRLDLDHHQQQHHQHLQHHQHQPESPDPNGHIQLHHMTSSSLSDHNAHHNNHSSSTYMLSSSLGTSGLGLSGDLEDLDYKQTTIDNQSAKVLYDAGDHIGLDHQHLQSSHQFLHQIHAGGSDSGGSGASMKQSNSTTSSKTKLNTPRRNAWGNMSYADLISQAINSTNDKRLTLSQIYDWMVQNVPYFKDKGDSNSSAGWKNSVRHNLSLHNRFKRLQNEGTGKSSWWTINPEADIGKCARRRAASMEASKYEKKRGRAKKNADAIRQSLISYPSLTN